MNWLAKFRRDRNLKKLAAKLPRLLASGWGRSKTYTAGQIRTALGDLKTPIDLRSFAFAAFLEESEYNSLENSAERQIPYSEAKQAFADARVQASNTYHFGSAADDYSSSITPPADGF